MENYTSITKHFNMVLQIHNKATNQYVNTPHRQRHGKYEYYVFTELTLI